MSEFTKGEWKPIDCETKSQYGAWKVKSGSVWICTVWGDDGLDAEANARLIASAPNLKQQRDDLRVVSHNLAETMAIDYAIKVLSASDDTMAIGASVILGGIQQQAKKVEAAIKKAQ